MAQQLRWYRRFGAVFPVIKTLFPKQAAGLIRSALRQPPQQIPTALLTPVLDLIAEHHFPVAQYDVEEVLELFPYLPLQTVNFDETSEFEEEPLALGFAAACCGYYEHAPTWDDIQKRLGNSVPLPDCFLDHDHRCRFARDAFDARCLAEPSPVNDFPLIRRLMDHDTHSIFLDAASAYEQVDHQYTWTVHDIRALTTDWRRARQIYDGALRCAQALDEHPHHWNTIFHHWTTLCRTATPSIV